MNKELEVNEIDNLPNGITPSNKKINSQNINNRQISKRKRRSKSDFCGMVVNCSKTAINRGRNLSKLNNYVIKQKKYQQTSKVRCIKNSSKISQQVITMSDFFQANIPLKHKNDQFVSGLVKSHQVKATHRKIKTQIQPFQYHEPSNLFHLKKIQNISYNHSLNPQKYTCQTISKIKDFSSPQKIRRTKSTIERAQKLRENKKLKPNPKQWHFHNCLSLQKIELYRTNLKLSCESWVCLDVLELKYLRGWNPKQIDDFTPLLRVLLAKSIYEINSDGLIDYESLMIRVNVSVLPKVLSEYPQHKLGIPSNSILSLRKLVDIMLMTDYDDIMFHVVLNLGYIFMKLQQIKKERQKNLENELNGQQNKEYKSIILQEKVYIREKKNIHQYYYIVEKYIKNMCKQLHLYNTKLVISQKAWSLDSTALDMSVLMMKSIAYTHFKQALSFKTYSPQIRYQIGWNFWESRVLSWKNQQFLKYRLKAVGGKNKKKNECFVVWNQQKNIVIALADSKVNMHSRDVERIEEWVQTHIQRFKKNYYINMTFYPTDTMKYWNIS